MSKLFEPVQLGALQLRNRIVFPPMGTRFASQEGFVTPRQIAYYARRAQGGAALVTVEYTAVDPVQIGAPCQVRASHDRFIPGLADLARSIKAHGARAAIQLHHPGRQASPKITGVQAVAPSPVPAPGQTEPPRELTIAEILELEAEFGQAARRVKEAGFEAVELHGAHGYLLCQFLSTLTNRRQDGYGGNLEKRTRFAREVVTRVRKEVGPGFPIIFRISAHEYADGGLTPQDTRVIARLLEEAGVDAISVSAGHPGVSMEWTIQPMLLPRACLVPLAREIKQAARVPVIVAGRLGDPGLASRVLEEGKADLIAIGRGILADPDLPTKALNGRSKEIHRCIACNSCRDPVSRQESTIMCLVNPEVGWEGQEGAAKAERPRRVLVLGGGPAGIEAASQARLRGHEVTLWHEQQSLDGPWAWLIKPYLQMQKDKLRRLGVKIELGKGIDSKDVTTFGPDVVLATPNSTPIHPAIPGLASGDVVTSDQAIAKGKALGKSVVVLGAGNIGCQVAYALSHLGVEVTLIESGPLAGYGLEDLTRRVLLKRLQRLGVKVLTGTVVVRRDGASLHCKGDGGGDIALQADCVVVALGSKPESELADQLKNDFQVISLPYCERPQEAYNAARAGREAARHL